MKRQTLTPSSESGQSMVEFAISLTVIMILLAGAVEFGIALFQYVQLRDAAQEGALYGSLNPSDTNGIIAHVKSASDRPINLQTDTDVTITPTVIGTACEGNAIQVTVSYPHQITMPFVSAIIGSTTMPISVSVTDTILLPIC